MSEGSQRRMSEDRAPARPRPAEEADPAAAGSPDRGRFSRCFSGLELALEAGPLKDLDSEKLKEEIKKWAKKVVAYARQISFGSGSSRGRSDSSRRGSDSRRGGVD